MILKFNKKLLIKSVVFFIVGIVNGYYFLEFKLIFVFTLGLLSVYFLFVKTKKYIIYFLIFTLILGFFYMLYYELNYYSNYSTTNYHGKTVEVIGKIKYKLDSLEGTSVNLKPILINNKRVKYGKIQLWKSDIKADISHNDLIIARIQLKKPSPKRNPGGFSYYNYLKKKQIYSIGNVFELYKIQSSLSIMKIFIKIKRVLLSAININIDDPVKEFIKALILGERSNLNVNWEDNFRRAGANHLLAISGLHIGFISIFILLLLNRLPISEITETIILTIFLLIYVIITGFRASVLRASLLALLYKYFKLLNIEIDFYSIISLVLFIILLINPYQLFSIGLQLSFLVLLMIISWAKIIQRYFCTTLAVSIAAQLGSIPLTAYYFNTLSPAGIITNLWAIPMVSVIVFLVLTHFTLYLFFPVLAVLSGKIIFLLSTILKKGISLMSSLPSAELKVITPSVITVFLSYIILFTIAYLINNRDKISKKNFRLYKFSLIFLISFIIFITVILPTQNNLLEIYCLDIGQGDSIFIKTPKNRTLLVDTGGVSGNLSKVKGTIIPFLLSQGIKTIDFLIITHFDGDHCTKAELLIEQNFIKNLIVSKNLDINYYKTKKIIDKAKEKGINIYWVEDNDKLNLQSVQLKYLAPIKGLYFKSRNDNSIVFKLTYEDFEMLFTGDIEKDAEDAILNYGSEKEIKADILKVAHHGSETSSIKEFINKVRPKEAIISVGKNKYGHPNSKIIKKLKIIKSRVWRTDHNGAIIIKTNGIKYSISSYLN